MIKMLKIFKQKLPLLLLVGLVVGSSFRIGATAHADIEIFGYTVSWTDIFIGPIIFILQLIFGAVIAIEGFIIQVFVVLLGTIMGYSDFIHAPAVNLGWTVVRDVSNLFFVVVLLFIAIGTILQIENYSFKKLLPKILLMAVLVNFSLLIPGLIIDASQVLTLAFAASFDQTIGLNIFKTLNITQITEASAKFTKETVGVTDLLDVVINGILAVIFLGIAMVVIVIFGLVLLARMIALWLLLVLAPLPYILSAFPYTKKYAQMWWEEFTKYVVVGPSLAFFLWLAFAVVNQGDFAVFNDVNSTLAAGGGVLSNRSIFIEIAKTGNFLTYLIGMAMLVGGLMVTQRLSVAGGSLAGNMAGKIKNLGAQSPLILGSWLARKTKAGALPNVKIPFTRVTLLPLKKLAGVELNPFNVAKNIQHALQEKKDEDIRRGNMAAGAILKQGGLKGAMLGYGAKEWGDNYLKGFMFSQGVKRVIYGKAGESVKYEKLAQEQEKIANGMSAADLQSKERERGRLTSEQLHVQSQLDTDMLSLDNDDIREAMEELDKVLADKINSLKQLAGKAGKDGDEQLKQEYEKQVKEAEMQRGAIASGVDANNNLDLANLKNVTDEATYDLVVAQIESVASKYENQAKELQSEINQRTDNGRAYTPEEVRQARDKAEKLREKAQRAAAFTPQDTASRGERRSAFEEKRRSFGDTTNEHELMAAFKSAVARDELTESGGVVLQAAKVGHLNELVQAHKVDRDYYFDEKGNITSDKSKKDTSGRFTPDGVAFAKGSYLSSDVNGLNAFMQDVFVHELGASEQVAFSLQNDLSNIAESVNHWTFGQSVTTDSDGVYRQNNKETQQIRTYIEMGKQDYENLSRRGNRLAWMTETWIDGDPSKGRKAILNNVGIDSIKSNYKAMNANFGRSRVNKNLILNLVEEDNMEILKKIGESINKPEEKAEWDKFIKNVVEFAGKAADEKGSVAQRAAKELAAAEDIREQHAGRREGFVD